MGKLIITERENRVGVKIVGGPNQSFDKGSLTASNGSTQDTVNLYDDVEGKFIAKNHPISEFVSSSGTAFSGTQSGTVTAINNIVNASPETFVKNTDKVTALNGVIPDDFTSKPGYTVFVGDTDGSLKTSDALLYSVETNGGFTSTSLVLGDTLNTNNNNITSYSGQHIKFFPGANGNVGIGTNSPSEKLTVRSGTIKIDDGSNPYVFPTADGANGQVLTTDGQGALSFTSMAAASDTNLGNSDITANDNRTYDADGNDLRFDPNGGEFTVDDSSGSPSLPEIQVGQGQVYLRGDNIDIKSGGLVFTNSDIKLGDDLNVQSHSIYTSTTNADIQLTPNGTGSVNLDGTVQFKRFDTTDPADIPTAEQGKMYADTDDNLFFGVSDS